ncbi:MAG TPA: metallophosphoesterase [Polyangiaceae bacterium LLY-WYZ-14_1]|nr:metallophosphoesterase [Polyangiaceae bacterium LLY-WYZ-14_1]
MAAPRTFVVGDLHGCRAELDALLVEAGFRPGSSDELVSVGDIVAKGPDSIETIRRLRALGARGVRGNHDDRVLGLWGHPRARPVASAPASENRGGPAPASFRTGSPRLDTSSHAGVAGALDAEDGAWLAALPFFLELPEHGAVVVHAGVVPGVPLRRQQPKHLMTMRSLRRDGTPSPRIAEGEPWSSRWPGPELVVFGHDAVRGLQVRPHALGLDTGCVYGGRLTGVWLPERTIVSVPAARRYAAVG